MALVQAKTSLGVANGDYIELTFDSSVTAGNRILIFGGSYNNTAILQSHFSQPSGTATVGTFQLDASVTRTGDGFAAAIASVAVTGTGSCTIRMNVDGNNYYALYLEEWSGVTGTVLDSGEGQNTNSATATTTDAPNGSPVALTATGADGVAFGMFTHASGNTSITPGTGWTEQHEMEDNSSTLCHSIIMQEVAEDASVTPTWNLGGAASWICCGVIYALEAAPPPATWSDSVDIVNVQTGQITASHTPAIGGTFIITCDCWRPTDKGVDPTASMISSNNGGAFTRDHLLSTTEVDVANENAHGLAHIRHIVESISSLPYTFDIDLGEAGSYGQWTATYYPDIDNSTSPVLYTGKDYKPHTGDDPNILPQEIPCAVAPITIQWSNVWISTTAANGGHDGTIDVNAPAGYTSRHKQNENSAKYSGHTADKFLETPGSEHPIYDVDQPVSPEAGVGAYVRGSMVVYRTTSSVQEEGGAAPGRMLLLGVG